MTAPDTDRQARARRKVRVPQPRGLRRDRLWRVTESDLPPTAKLAYRALRRTWLHFDRGGELPEKHPRMVVSPGELARAIGRAHPGVGHRAIADLAAAGLVEIVDRDRRRGVYVLVVYDAVPGRREPLRDDGQLALPFDGGNHKARTDCDSGGQDHNHKARANCEGESPLLPRDAPARADSDLSLTTTTTDGNSAEAAVIAPAEGPACPAGRPAGPAAPRPVPPARAVTADTIARATDAAGQVVRTLLGERRPALDYDERQLVVGACLVAELQGWVDWPRDAARRTAREVRRHAGTPRAIANPLGYWRRMLGHDLFERLHVAARKSEGRGMLARLLREVEPHAREIERRTRRADRPSPEPEREAAPPPTLADATADDRAAGRAAVAAALAELRAIQRPAAARPEPAATAKPGKPPEPTAEQLGEHRLRQAEVARLLLAAEGANHTEGTADA